MEEDEKLTLFLPELQQPNLDQRRQIKEIDISCSFNGKLSKFKKIGNLDYLAGRVW